MMHKLTLRERQEKGYAMVRDAFRAGHKRVMLYAPCSYGKTELSIKIMMDTMEKGKRSGFIVDRIVLCEQTSSRLDKYYVDHGILQSGHHRYKPYHPIQVCSAQTLEARGTLPDMDLMIIDEAHGTRSMIKEFMHNSDIYTLGVSGSPVTKGLGKLYDHIVSPTTINEMLKEGDLCPLKVYIAKETDMTGAKKVAGEWSAKEATARGKLIVGDVVNEWIKKTHEHFGKPEKTIVFTAGVEHGEALEAEFRSHGYNFVNISYKDDDEFKRQTLENFKRPDTDIHGVLACDILTKGWDDSSVRIGISTRAYTKSFSSHVQQLGRLQRTFEGKEYGLWLDHSGNYLRFLNDWNHLCENGVTSLDDTMDKPKTEPTERIKEAAKCPRCSALWEGGMIALSV